MKRQQARSPRKWSNALALAMVAVQISACATMFSGRTQALSIRPDPTDALVTVDGTPYRGPQTVTLDRSQVHTIRVERPGFESETTTIEQALNGLFWLNFLWGCAFPVGMIVDSSTGAMWKLDPDVVNVALRPLPAH